MVCDRPEHLRAQFEESGSYAKTQRRLGGRLPLYSAVALALVLGLAACTDDPLRPCEDALAAQEFPRAVTVCEDVFQTTEDSRAAAAAAEAHRQLGHNEDVLAWNARVESGPGKPRLLRLAAGVWLRQGERDQATDAYRQALELDRGTEDLVGVAKDSYGLFYLAWTSSDFRSALIHATEAAEAARGAEDRAQESKALRGLLALRYDLGDLQGSWQTLRAAEDLLSPEDASARARLLVYESLFHVAEGQNSLGRAALEKALQTATGDEDASFFRSAHLNLVKIHLDLDDPDAARQHLEEAWTHADPEGQGRDVLLFHRARVAAGLGNTQAALEALDEAQALQPIPDWSWRMDLLRGQAEESLGRTEAASKAYQHSTETLEDLRSNLGFDDLKAWLLDEKRQPYEALFVLHAEAGRPLEALATLERVKARTLLEAFTQATQQASAEDVSAAADRWQALEDFFPAMGQSPVLGIRPLEEVLERLRPHHLHLFFEAGDYFWLVQVTDGRPTVRRLAPSAEITRMASGFLAAPGDLDAAAQLGALLFPRGTRPPPGRRLYLVTDGVLGRLPTAALRVDGRFLVESHELLEVPGLNFLAALEDLPPHPHDEILVLGNPSGDLPGAEQEVQEVAQILDSQAFLREQVTRARFLQQGSKASVLHVAAHAGLDARGPWVGLAGERLRGFDILQHRVAPRLVVLASCLGAAPSGRGLWGTLGASFLAAFLVQWYKPIDVSFLKW